MAGTTFTATLSPLSLENFTVFCVYRPVCVPLRVYTAVCFYTSTAEVPPLVTTTWKCE